MFVLGFWSVSFGFRPCFLPSRAYFRVCVSVEVSLSTETSRYGSNRSPDPPILDFLDLHNAGGFSCCFWGRSAPQTQQLNPRVLCKSGTSYIGGFSRTGGCSRRRDFAEPQTCHRTSWPNSRFSPQGGDRLLSAVSRRSAVCNRRADWSAKA